MPEPTFTIVLQADPDDIDRALQAIGCTEAIVYPGRLPGDPQEGRGYIACTSCDNAVSGLHSDVREPCDMCGARREWRLG